MKSFVIPFIVICLFLGSDNFCHCLRMKVIPGIPSLPIFDKQYVEDVTVKTRRNGRRGEYAVTIEFINKHTWNNNVSLHFIFYEFLHNEYRPSFVEMHYKFCDLVQIDMIIGPSMRRAGMICPLPPGKHSYQNVTYDQEFPSVFPFEKGKVDLIGNVGANGKQFVRAGLEVQFKMLP